MVFEADEQHDGDVIEQIDELLYCLNLLSCASVALF